MVLLFLSHVIVGVFDELKKMDETCRHLFELRTVLRVWRDRWARERSDVKRPLKQGWKSGRQSWNVHKTRKASFKRDASRMWLRYENFGVVIVERGTRTFSFPTRSTKPRR